jgi:hypothetical protein
VGPRAGLDTEATGKTLLPLSGIEPRSPCRLVHSQTLSYPANTNELVITIFNDSLIVAHLMVGLITVSSCIGL